MELYRLYHLQLQKPYQSNIQYKFVSCSDLTYFIHMLIASRSMSRPARFVDE